MNSARRRVEKLEAAHEPTGARVAFVQIHEGENEEQAMARTCGDSDPQSLTHCFIFDLRGQEPDFVSTGG